MSATMLLTVESMINLAMGEEKENTVNFKLIRSILHVLAKQLRMLEQKIEIRSDAYFNDEQYHHEDITDEPTPPSPPSPLQLTLKTPKQPETAADTQEKGKVDTSSKQVDDKGTKKSVEKVIKKEEKQETQEKEEKPTKADKDKNTKPKGSKKGADKKQETISIKEEQRDNEKVLVVEEAKSFNAPILSRTASLSERRQYKSASEIRQPTVGSVEVVSRVEYMELQKLVHELKSLAAPIPNPTLPDNQQLRDDIATGQAKLTDTMEAMQVTARIDAAEQGIEKLISLLTSVVSSGAMPPALQRKSTQLLQLSMKSQPAMESFSPGHSLHKASSARPATEHVTQTEKHVELVSRPQMDSAFEILNGELTKQIAKINKQSVTLVSEAIAHLHELSAKMEDALSMQELLDKITAELTIYYEQLHGFDDGFTSQLTNNEIQILKMQSDLKYEVERIEAATGNTETAAVRELTERYESLVQELDAANFTNAQLHAYQISLQDELKRLTDSVELLSEMKSDRVELMDNLSDKADKSQLYGLLKETVFKLARRELEEAIAVCDHRFDVFDNVWHEVLNDLKSDIDEKASHIQLHFMENQFNDDIEDMRKKLNQLAAIIGEPSAAILTRKISKDGNCGICQVPALMPMPIGTHMERPPVPGQEDIQWMPPPQEKRTHYCKRWCGGSHTIINANIKHIHDKQNVMSTNYLEPIKGLGDDGKTYLFENVMEPCRECNPSLDGDGDVQ